MKTKKSYFNKITAFDVVVTLIMLFVLIITFYPFMNVLATSLSKSDFVLRNEITIFPKGINLEAYSMILETNRIPLAYWNSILYTVAGTAISILLTAIMAYPLSRKRLVGKKLFMAIAIIPMIFTGGLIPTYILMRNLNILNTVWCIILPNAIGTYQLLIIKTFFENMPEELFESAHIDGASEFTIMFRICFPLSGAALASIGLFYGMGFWNDFFTPMIYLNDIAKQPLPVILKEMLVDDQAKQSSDNMNYAHMASQALKNSTIVLSMLPVLITYPFVQKFFVKGVMVGSVKG